MVTGTRVIHTIGELFTVFVDISWAVVDEIGPTAPVRSGLAGCG
jgi:hypothetical protein